MRHDRGPKGVDGFYKLRRHQQPTWTGQLFFGLQMAALEYGVTICYWCNGTGDRDSWVCSTCKGACLLQNGEPAPASVTMQVYNAGAAWRLVNDVV